VFQKRTEDILKRGIVTKLILPTGPLTGVEFHEKMRLPYVSAVPQGSTDFQLNFSVGRWADCRKVNYSK